MTSHKVLKKHLPINANLQCEVKSIDAPFDYTDDMHNHFCHEILIVFEGELNFYTEFSGRILKHGDVGFIPHYMFHTGDILNPERYDRAVINVTDEILRSASSCKMNLCACFVPYNDNDTSLHTIHLDDEELEEIKNYCILLQKNLTHPTKESEILPEIVSRTFEYIERHLTDEITLASLEKEIHHNGTYISRCVKKFSGLSIQQYIIAKKIALACKLLKEGLSPSDVCFMSGFNNYSNFSRTFSKQVGQSPKQLQMAYRNVK